MGVQLRDRLTRLTSRLPLAAGTAVAAVGGLAIAGRALGVTAIPGVPLDLSGIRAAAAPLTLAGLALALLSRANAHSSRRLLGRAAAAASCLLVVLTLLEPTVSAGLVPRPTDRPGVSGGEAGGDRLPIDIAVPSLMLGAALLFLDARRSSWLAEALAVVPTFLGLLTVLWDVLLLATPSARRGELSHPLPAAAFLALGAGILCARPGRGLAAIIASERMGGVLARRLLPVAVLAPSLLLWAWLLATRSGLIRSLPGAMLYFLTNMVVFSGMVLWAAAALNRLDATRRRAEDESRARADQLAEADRRKDEFLAVLAHELRNPLAPLRTALRLLGLPGADAGRVRGIMERQVEHLVRLVDDLLDVSRMMRDKIELRVEPVELSAVVARAVETSRPAIDAEWHELSVSPPPGPVWVRGDVVRLAQVVSNLLNNAARYTPQRGRIGIAWGREGDRAVVRVRDTGVGIPADMLTRIFDMFVQAGRETKDSRGGLGIGLTLVKSLVERHGGRVEADSPGPGRGSEFTVTLPAVDGGPAPRPGDGTVNPGRGVPPRRVLVVDDNVDAAESLAALLRLGGHEVRVAHDGAAALGLVRQGLPEVALLDIGMPGMDGCELARRLRQLPGAGGVVLVAVTGWGQEEDRRRTGAAGFDRHLVKPVDPDDLYRLLACPDQAAAPSRRPPSSF